MNGGGGTCIPPQTPSMHPSRGYGAEGSEGALVAPLPPIAPCTW